MFKKGISIFTGLSDYTKENNLKYLYDAYNEGYEIVFSSCHINEATTTTEELQELINEVVKLGMKLSLDISKPMYEKLILPNDLYALRLDYGFSDEDMIELSKTKKFKIELNASCISKEKLLNLIEKGLNPEKIRMSFNYYPKPYTAHSIEFCEEIVKFCHELNIKVGAFLPSKSGKRPPLYEGLPSVESHRMIELDLAIEEFKAIEIDEILFGDAYASHEELRTLSLHQTEELLVKFEPYNEFNDFNHIDGVLKTRPDFSPYFLRVSSKRIQGELIPFNTINRNINDVTVDNDLFKRYKGEINIMLKNLPSDERVNVIGKVNTTKIVVDKIEKGHSFRFVK